MWKSVTVSEVTPYQIQYDTLVLFVLKGCLATYHGSGAVSAANRLSSSRQSSTQNQCPYN